MTLFREAGPAGWIIVALGAALLAVVIVLIRRRPSRKRLAMVAVLCLLPVVVGYACTINRYFQVESDFSAGRLDRAAYSAALGPAWCSTILGALAVVPVLAACAVGMVRTSPASTTGEQ